MDKDKSNIRKAISIFLSFLLSLFIVLAVLVFVFKMTVLNEQYFREQINKSSYTENVIEKIDKTFVSYGIVSGFDEKFFKSILTTERVKTDIYREVSRLYSTQNNNIDFEAFQKFVYDSLVQNVNERQLEITEKVDEALQYLAQTCTEAYINAVSFPFISKVSSVILKVQPYINIALGIVIGLCVFTSGIILYINPWRRRKIRYFMYSFGGSVLMLLAPTLFAIYSNKISKIGISDKALYFLITSWANNLFSVILAFTMGLAIIWIVLAVIRIVLYTGGLFPNKNKKNNAV